MVQQVKTRMTAAEFLALPDERHPIQLLDGELIKVHPPVPDHQRIVRRLILLFDGLVPNGEIFTAPLAVFLDEDNVPEPDVVWVAEDGRCVVTDAQLEGPPDLVVEVLSPSTARYDKTIKFDLYERHGVREYWIVDPVHELLEVWTLDEGMFTRQGVYGLADEAFASPVLGDKAVDLNAIFNG